ncbi:pyruvate dehydrogenase [acetyl-transferring]-phosphatase 1, mitochondrial-like [Artemia franciscana]|uniref:PPM-type phosphatase domain-containing protein n=1 Tax=Artemia franciscana TaxID=6661 RepID=A0AA88HWG8_ARTSF|nr:hypothetical protein QYM36_005634 [Artemia franciscana]
MAEQGVKRHAFKDNVNLLSPVQATEILRANEMSRILTRSGAVKAVEWNQLGSNIPIEDTLAVAHCKHSKGMLFGVFDGHSGPYCARVLSNWMFPYIATALTPIKELQNIFSAEHSKDVRDELLENVTENIALVPELHEVYTRSLRKYAAEKLKTDSTLFETTLFDDAGVGKDALADDVINDAAASLEQAFLRLDDDLSREALASTKDQKIAFETMAAALSGAVSNVAHVHNNILSVANVGDCQTVLGSLGEGNKWISTRLSSKHTTENQLELNRVFSEHPPKERNSVIVGDRLLGHLMPLRAFGDFLFKWSKEVIQEHVIPYFRNVAAPLNYHTPPYLTVRPEIRQHRLSDKDKFLILATDGLWDFLTPSEAVKIVGEHLLGHEAPEDVNAATHLLRHALAGTAAGLDHDMLAKLLTIPKEIVRNYRDDISVVVVYFDSEYLQKYPFQTEISAQAA